jgi:hypothetical protein
MLLEVEGGGMEYGRLILEEAEAFVAQSTQQAPDFSTRVAVIDM